MSKLLSDKVKKIPPTEVSADRYEFLKLGEAEPDLGVPSIDGQLLASTTSGVRSWTNASSLVGYTGSKGDIGFTGSQGIQGPGGGDGSLGYTGSIGFTGSQGIQGTTGFVGSQGVTGFTGSQGIQGVTGFAGSVGFVGSQGVQGVIGFTGSQGIQGVTGFTGSKGDQGTIGFTGSQGIQGTTGFVGSKGDQGTIGFTGSQGIQGTTGFVGSQGIQGVTGFTGSVGFVGSQGIQGTTGFVGSQGIQGVTGFTGSVGFVGSKGDQGIQGIQGNFGGATFDYTFDTATTAADPGVGKIRFNNATLPSATAMYIDASNDAATDISTFLNTIDDSTSTIKGHFRISKKADASAFALYTITSLTNNTGWFTVNASYVSGNSTFANLDDIIVTFARTGDKGDTGFTGSVGFVGSSGALEAWSRKTANYTAINGDRIIADTSGGTFVVTLPATPALGAYLQIADGADWQTTNLTIARNASTIEGLAEDLIVDIKGAILELVYDGTTWEVFASLGVGTARNLPTVTSITGATGGVITPSSNFDQYNITALGASCSFAAVTGTPIDGQKLSIRIYGTAAQTISSWASGAGGYRALGTTLPTTSVASKTIYVGCIYNSADTIWDVIAVATQA